MYDNPIQIFQSNEMLGGGLNWHKTSQLSPLLRIRTCGVGVDGRRRHCCRHSGVPCLIYSRVSVRYLGCPPPPPPLPPLLPAFPLAVRAQLIADNVGLGSSKIPLLPQTDLHVLRIESNFPRLLQCANVP